ncbi:aminotransferase class IV family protein [Kitasatospora sp. NPDC002040]|uniref:aminotransferase class IV family protein n=1 Tax=Kitasatospora sp. NPDC002040 TaxID=3154661 RepID=UPI00333326C8
MAELNGRPVTPAELQALALTNYGHFTTMLVRDGRVRGLGLHLERLRRDCRALFGTDLDPEPVRAYARRAVPAGGSTMVRITVFDPALDLGNPGGKADPAVLVTTRAAGGAVPGPLRVRPVRYERDRPEVKGVGLFGALRHRREAQLAGYDDALFVDGTGAVSEGGTWNLGLVRDGGVVWPEAAYLPGTTLALLRDLHPGRTARVTPAELPQYEAAFATNAAVGVRPIAAVEGTALDPGHPLLTALAEAWAAAPGEPL